MNNDPRINIIKYNKYSYDIYKQEEDELNDKINNIKICIKKAEEQILINNNMIKSLYQNIKNIEEIITETYDGLFDEGFTNITELDIFKYIYMNNMESIKHNNNKIIFYKSNLRNIMVNIAKYYDILEHTEIQLYNLYMKTGLNIHIKCDCRKCIRVK